MGEVKHSRGLPVVSKSDSFGPILKTRPISRTNRLMLHYLPGSEALSLGIMVPKRLAKRAVDRHTLKRLVREACRLELEQSLTGQILVRLNRPVSSIPFSGRPEWWKEIRQLLNALSQL